MPVLIAFAMRWQQYTGPVMAKGHEDTAMYVYNRLMAFVRELQDGRGYGEVVTPHGVGRHDVAIVGETIAAVTAPDALGAEDVARLAGDARDPKPERCRRDG